MKKYVKELSKAEMNSIISETIDAMSMDTELERIKKDWNGEDDSDEEFDAHEFFGDAGDAAEADIRAEFGDDEFASFGSLEDPNMLRDLGEGFDDEIEGIKRDWGGEDDSYEEFDAHEFFGDAGDAAEEDIKAEFGDDEFASFGSLEDPNMLKDLNEDDDEAVEPKGLFRPKDSEGNDIKLKSLVKHVSSDKKGRVKGFGDDGKGNMIVRVEWAWPIDRKFMEPEEMGEMREKPEDLVIQGLNEDENSSMDSIYSFNSESLFSWFQDALLQLKEMDVDDAADIMEEEFEKTFNYSQKSNNYQEDEDEVIDEVRGLGKAVKNTGNRNVKQRDDRMASPLTNLNESVNNSIKNVMSKKLTKKELVKFINEEAKKVAKNII